MKKLVRLLVLFVALGFAVVSCSEGEDTTAGGDLGGGTGGGGDNPSGSLGKLEDSEFIKNGNEIIGVDGAIDNTTSMIYFSEYPVWTTVTGIASRSFTVKNNSSSRLEVQFPNVLTGQSYFRLYCFNADEACIHITGINKVTVKPNVQVNIRVDVDGAVLNKNRVAGNKTEKMLFVMNNKQVAVIDLKYTLQPLAEKYLDLSVTSTEIDFGDVPKDTKVTKYIEFNDKGDVRDMLFSVDASPSLADGITISNDNITTTYWIDDGNGKVQDRYLEYLTGQVDKNNLDRATGSPFYLHSVIVAGDNIPVVTECNIYNEKKCLVPIVFYPAKEGEVLGNIVIDVRVKTPSNHPDGYEVEYTKSFTINFKGNGVNQ